MMSFICHDLAMTCSVLSGRTSIHGSHAHLSMLRKINIREYCSERSSRYRMLGVTSFMYGGLETGLNVRENSRMPSGEGVLKSVINPRGNHCCNDLFTHSKAQKPRETLEHFHRGSGVSWVWKVLYFALKLSVTLPKWETVYVHFYPLANLEARNAYDFVHIG